MESRFRQVSGRGRLLTCGAMATSLTKWRARCGGRQGRCLSLAFLVLAIVIVAATPMRHASAELAPMTAWSRVADRAMQPGLPSATPAAGTSDDEQSPAAPTPSTSPEVSGDQDSPDYGLAERFLTSAGFGGLMAFLAACIAASIAWRQYRLAAAQQALERERQRADRWWETLTWVYDRTIVEEGKKAPLPDTVTLSLLSALNEESKAQPSGDDRLQAETISAMLSMFPVASAGSTPGVDKEANQRDEAGARTDTPGGLVAEPESPTDGREELLQELRADLESRGYVDQSVLRARALTYERQVASALERICTQRGWTLQQHRRLAGYEIDFVVEAENHRGWVSAVIPIEARYASGGSARLVAPLLRRSAQRLERLVAASPSASGAILVSNQEPGKAPPAKVRHVVWRDAPDDSGLESVLVDMLVVGPGSLPS